VLVLHWVLILGMVLALAGCQKQAPAVGPGSAAVAAVSVSAAAKAGASSDAVLDEVYDQEDEEDAPEEAPESEDTAKDWFAQGQQYWRQGNCPAATKAFEKAVQQQPGNSDAHRMYGYCLMDSGLTDQAIAHIEVPANAESKDPEVWARLARLYRKKKQYDQALACALKAEKLSPDSVLLSRLLGSALMDKGQYAQAIKAYMKVLEKDDKAWVRNNLGMAYLETGEPERAHKELLRAVFLEPKNPLFHNNLGVAYQRLDRLTEAHREFSEALRLDPAYTRARYNKEALDLKLKRLQATTE
jgi:tetratricopeptide (TPR) repeat protein